MRKMQLAFVCVACLASPLSADEGLPPKTLAAIKRATVFVEVEVEGLTGSGSGFVVSVDGTSALVVTNHHVVEPKIIAQANRTSSLILAAFPPKTLRPSIRSTIPRPIGPTGPRTRVRELPPGFTPRLIIRTLKNAAVTVVFDSGTKEERSAKAELLAIDPDYDLAVMRVKDVKDLPEPIRFEKPAELAETMAIYTFGFPFGKVLSTSKGHPAMTVSKAAISSLRENDEGELVLVQIDGGLNPGNSGGPIVNAKGELAGVAVATIRNSNGIGLAIPSGPLRNMFEGRIGDIHLATKPNADKPALTVEVGVIDPLGKIASVELHSIAVSRATAGADKGIESLDALSGIEKTKLTLEKQLASGEIALASGTSDKEYLVQAVYTTAQGKPMKTRVFQQSLKAPVVAAITTGQNQRSGDGAARGVRRDENPSGATKIFGGPGKPEFKDQAPENGLLIGLEIGLGKFGRNDVVKAIRPIYRADEKETFGQQYGMPPTDVVTVQARQGYAVGGLTVRAGLLVDGLSVTFMRVVSGKVDPTDSYESDWIGSTTGGSLTKLNGDGKPVIGIVGKASDKECTGIGLLFDK